MPCVDFTRFNFVFYPVKRSICKIAVFLIIMDMDSMESDLWKNILHMSLTNIISLCRWDCLLYTIPDVKILRIQKSGSFIF